MSKILIVDDDQDFLAGMKLILDSAALDYIATASTDNIRRKVKIYRPSLIILDLFLQSTNGIEIAYDLKKYHDTRFIPILLISGSDHLKELYRQTQAQAYLRKPFTPNELIATISRLVGKDEGSVFNRVAKAAYRFD